MITMSSAVSQRRVVVVLADSARFSGLFRPLWWHASWEPENAEVAVAGPATSDQSRPPLSGSGLYVTTFYTFSSELIAHPLDVRLRRRSTPCPEAHGCSPDKTDALLCRANNLGTTTTTTIAGSNTKGQSWCLIYGIIGTTHQ